MGYGSSRQGCERSGPGVGRDGVCNPVAYVLFEATASGTAANVTDGKTYPLRL